MRATALRRGTLCALIFGVGTSLGTATEASGQLRAVTYNIASLEGNSNDLQDVFASLNDDPEPGTGLIRVPDIYVFQEIASGEQNTLRNWLNNNAPVGITYSIATYTSNGGGGENALIYRSDTITEITSGHRDITNHSGPRATDRWQLSLADDPSTVFYVYGSHFKASQGSDNEDKRESEANAIRNDADSLGDGTFVLYAGDWNVYSPSEPAFERMTEPGNGQAVDPGHGGSFPTISHTQSPHDGSDNNLVTGGMDDRFDFILCSDELDDGLGFDVSGVSYRAFGNDGAHFNQAINAGFNSYFDASEQWKADALARASDHLPVVVDYLLPNDPFRLTVLPLVAGETGTLQAFGADNGETVYFVYSLAGLGATNVPQLGVDLRLEGAVLGGQSNANQLGIATLNKPIPSGLSGTTVWLQAAISGKASDVVVQVIE